MDRTRRTIAAVAAAFALAGCGGEVTTDGSGDSFTEESACVAGGTATYTLHPGSPLGPPLVGFGAEYNQNLYAQISRDVGVSEAAAAQLEPKLVSLAPEHVRIFFDSRAFADPDLMQSFVRSVELAERSGATINVTWWHGPYPDPVGSMHAFAAVLVDLVKNKGVAALRYVTIQNEVNSTKVTMPLYEQLYRTLDADLRAAGVRGQIQLVGGDLLSEDQTAWFQYLAAHMADVLDGYSVHIYWNWNDTAKLTSRLTEVRQIVNALPARKPLYVTEFGVRGIVDPGEPEPGHLPDGTLTERSTTSAIEQAWFDLLALRLGYVATVRWDAYFAKYDNGSQLFSLIGTPQNGWPLKPSYYLLRMLTHVVAPGDVARTVEGSATGRIVAATTGGGQTTLLLLNNNSCVKTFRLEGLPPRADLYNIVWNPDGKGGLVARPHLTSSASGAVTVSAPAKSLVAVTTRFPGLGL
jgi:hypothetical protein